MRIGVTGRRRQRGTDPVVVTLMHTAHGHTTDSNVTVSYFMELIRPSVPCDQAESLHPSDIRLEKTAPTMTKWKNQTRVAKPFKRFYTRIRLKVVLVHALCFYVPVLFSGNYMSIWNRRSHKKTWDQDNIYFEVLIAQKYQLCIECVSHLSCSPLRPLKL